MKNINELQDTRYQASIKESTQNIKEYIIEISNKAKETGRDASELIDEGLLSSIIGGVIGSTAGKSIMQGVCKALGVSENSTLGTLLTSRMVLTAVGAYLGYKW